MSSVAGRGPRASIVVDNSGLLAGWALRRGEHAGLRRAVPRLDNDVLLLDGDCPPRSARRIVGAKHRGAVGSLTHPPPQRQAITIPWHCLYFLPEPQGQGSLRPTLPQVDGLRASRFGRD